MNYSKNLLAMPALLLTLFVGSMLVSAVAFAGGGRSYRSNCIWINKRFKTWGVAGEFVFPLVARQHGHCSQATANRNLDHSGFNVRAGYSFNFTNRWNDRWWAWAGLGYMVPPSAPIDSIGYSEADFSDEVVLKPTSGTHGKIDINNITGELKAYDGTHYSTYYRILIWLPSNHNDTTIDEDQISADKIVWEAGVYLDTGVLRATGHFQNSMFSTQTRLDTFTNPKSRNEIRGDAFVISCSNESFSIDVKTDIIDVLTNDPGHFDPARISSINIDDLVVTISSHGGFGAFEDPYGYNDAYNKRAINENESGHGDNDDLGFNVYPNPFQDEVTLKFLPRKGLNNMVSIAHYRVINSAGIEVRRGSITSFSNGEYTIDMTPMRSGMYILIVEQNGVLLSKTILKY